MSGNHSTEKVMQELMDNLTVYETFYLGSTPYNVYINDDFGWLSVYGIPVQTNCVDSNREVSIKDECENIIENTSLYLDRDVSSYYNKLVLKCYFTELFVGKDNITNYDGNSLLMKNMNDSYTYIGDRVYNFSVPSDDIIIDFYSPIHDNNSYPLAIGKKNVYFLLHGVYTEKENIDLEEDKLDEYINYMSSNKMFKLIDTIKMIDNGYYIENTDLLQYSISFHTNSNHWNGLIQDYEINSKHFIRDQIKETEKFKKTLYSMYNIDNSDNSDNSDNDESFIKYEKEDLDWVCEYVSSFIEI